LVSIVGYTRYLQWCADWRAAGFKVVACTVLPRNNGGLYAGFEADRQTVNAQIRANWASFADALADMGLTLLLVSLAHIRTRLIIREISRILAMRAAILLSQS
jgi:hypothetical protein